MKHPIKIVLISLFATACHSTFPKIEVPKDTTMFAETDSVNVIPIKLPAGKGAAMKGQPDNAQK